MVKNGMYVRCPLDEDEDFHRDFVVGKVVDVNDFAEMATVEFYDVQSLSTYYATPEKKEYAFSIIEHIKIREGEVVKVKGKLYTVKCLKKNIDGLYHYYIQSESGEIKVSSEKDLQASFNSGDVFPITQLRSYEFQNPMWYCGRYVVSKTMNIINNSLYGFNEIAGCKIYLKTHQLRTVMRCLQEGKCRNMIADEVGMGKTIEAASVLKIFLKDNHNSKVLILTPDSLVEQWITELAYKFHIFSGVDANNNFISIGGTSKVDYFASVGSYDFIIVDEVHKYIQNDEIYNKLLKLSKETDNILMLSATPVQRRKEEYQKLLVLIQPNKYEKLSSEEFDRLLELQNEVVRKTHKALDTLDTYLEELDESDYSRNEDTENAYDDLIKALGKVQKLIQDDMFSKELEKVDYDSEDFGVEAVQSCIAYVCENYQFEKSIIRNRRDTSEEDDYNERQVIKISYDMQTDFNNTEYNIYSELSEWFNGMSINYDEFNSVYKNIIGAFLSSASAFKNIINSAGLSIPERIYQLADVWVEEEAANIKDIKKYMDDPEGYSSRLNNIIDYIDQEMYGEKILLFTDYDKTFEVYKDLLIKYFGKEHVATFSKDMNPDERELNAYRFETDKDYWILLSDSSGGEGRNFQNAACIIHIDIPWSANDLEQRIGRLDRIGRAKNKPVISVVPYAESTLEDDLVKFWDEGIGLFTKSQSGLEIVMNEMDERIVHAICSDFKFGLIGIIDDVSEELSKLKKIITEERYFDLAEFKYQTINNIMEDTRDLYVSNERKLFGDSMMGWSALSGFRASKVNDDVIRFDANSFSLKSAYNSLFVPPNMNLMFSDKINQIQNKVRKMNCERSLETDINYVQGTFNRNKAVYDDYIHFFAPGDPIFDSIVRNALGSYKGTCSAFACVGEYDWMGFIFTWNLLPDERFLYEAGLQGHIIDKYRGFMPSEQFQYAISISPKYDVDSTEILRTFNYMLASGAVDKKKFQHLGSRSGEHSNIDMFVEMYPVEQWLSAINASYEKALAEIRTIISGKLRKPLAQLKNELNKDIAAARATSAFFGESEQNEKKEQNTVIYSCFAKPRIKMDSVCFMRMVNGQRQFT